MPFWFKKMLGNSYIPIDNNINDKVALWKQIYTLYDSFIQPHLMQRDFQERPPPLRAKER